MNSEDAPPSSPAPRSGLWLMAFILLVMAAVAIFSNVQKARRAQIETVTIKPIASPTSSLSPTPSSAAP